MLIQMFRNASLAVAVAVACLLAPSTSFGATTVAKKLFGAKKLPAALKPAAHGFYSKGCLQGAVAIPADGPTWQAMRLERNRRWGHPDLINLVKRLSVDGRKVGWNGLLVGDISQPRGGPMLSGHASHQLGLDADVWLTPMPNRRLTRKERRNLSATSMLGVRSNGKLTNTQINKRNFTKAHFGIIKTAAKYRKVERVLVHPVIKRELCRMAKGDRSWLQKVRPYWGHHYHMHVRIGCPKGSPKCRRQAATTPGTGCGANLKWWFDVAFGPRKPRKKSDPPPKPRKPKPAIRMSNLPRECRVVLNAPSPGKKTIASAQAIKADAFVKEAKVMPAAKAAALAIIKKVPLPTFRPRR